MQIYNLRYLILIFIITLISSNALSLTQDLNYKLTQENNLNIAPVLSGFSDINKNLYDESAVIEPCFDQALDFCRASQEFWQNGEIENAIQSLDQAYSLILNVDDLSVPKLIQQKEDLRFMISKRILEIYASRNIKLKGDHKEIPVTLNKQVFAEIRRFTTYEKKFFAQSLARSGMYREMMLKSLKKAGLPAELSWLPLVESGFKLKALSSARALGLWQFVPTTGYMFGLKRDQFIDERIDPVKSTNAAVAYLKKMHSVFGDWSTVLAAYNCGPGRTLRLIRSQNINYLDNFWDLYSRLPRETARYVPRFLATLHIVKNLKKYGFDKVKLMKPYKYEYVEIEKQVHLKDIARILNTSSQIIKNLNPELRYNIVPDKKYSLRIPFGKTKVLLANIGSIKVSRPPQRAFTFHRVRLGESLSGIARKYRSSIRSIKRMNKISKSNYIVAGKILKIPQTLAYKKRKAVRNKYAKTHKVKSGDSLWSIARKYNTTPAIIKSLNKLTSSKVNINQIIKLPGKKRVSSNSALYRVQSGDSPFTIAAKHNMQLHRLLSLNSLKSNSKIYPGQRLYIE
ncbi:MAG: LysM peptidoglycan-binding domain-containing protein [Desulfobacterales bacterium]|nr:LysM peptidoglycan-binding domain-containing protein [Desulfobacterales bacterium]MCP4158461.1 LysM peptidoglycan-binding domain-containing protein [Deltaproteobacteria bacterium]